MSNVIGKAEKVIMALGLFAIILSLVSAVPATASGLGNTAGADAAPTGKLIAFAVDTARGARVAGAQVVVLDAVTGRSVAKGLTGADGSYSAALPAGLYKVAVFAAGYEEQSEAAKITSALATIVKIGIHPVNSSGSGAPASLR